MGSVCWRPRPPLASETLASVSLIGQRQSRRPLPSLGGAGGSPPCPFDRFLILEVSHVQARNAYL